MTKTIAVHTLGCKANQFDSACLLAAMPSDTIEVPFKSAADIYIVNTCTVTGKTDAQCRQAIRRAISLNPQALIIVTGCYAQVNPDQIAAISGVDYVVGNGAQHLIPELVKRGKPALSPQVLTGQREDFSLPPVLPRLFRRTRAFFKIQDGCDAFCAYCIIPYGRGKPRSLPPADVIAGLKDYAHQGVAEVVLTGIHLSAYGSDLHPPSSLAALVSQINRESPVLRIRLSSLEPHEIPPELIEQITSSQIICPHLHLSLQAANDEILARMGRKYTVAQVLRLVDLLKSKNPDICLGADLIAGLPGEDDACFRREVDFMENLKLDYFHVFPYSKRPGTPAAEMDGQVPERAKIERSRILRQMGQNKRMNFYQRFLDKNMPVLVERQRGPDITTGLSRNYIPVWLAQKGYPQGEELTVRIKKIEDLRVWGEVCNPAD